MLNDQQVYTMAEKIADLVKSQATKSDPTGSYVCFDWRFGSHQAISYVKCIRCSERYF